MSSKFLVHRAEKWLRNLAIVGFGTDFVANLAKDRESEELMNCHICSNEVEHVRSVMIRQWPDENDAWGVTKEPPQPDTPAYQHYCKNMQYRRAFICQSCYQKVDEDPTGRAEIPGLGEWNLAGKSRRGAAAVYDRAKWEGFQRSKAKTMGIEL